MEKQALAWQLCRMFGKDVFELLLFSFTRILI